MYRTLRRKQWNVSIMVLNRFLPEGSIKDILFGPLHRRPGQDGVWLGHLPGLLQVVAVSLSPQSREDYKTVGVRILNLFLVKLDNQIKVSFIF